MPDDETIVSETDRWEIRSLRRSEFASYRSVVLLAVGQLERSTGLDTSAEATIDQLSRRSIWLLLKLFRLIGHPVVDFLVAADGNEVVGTGTVLWLPNSAYVASMATKPEVRGRGIASQILARQDSLARRRHREWLALDVESENAPAIRVYRRAGYREAGSFTWYTRNGPPSSGVATSSETRLVRRSDWKELTAWIDASRPAEYRAAFPARARLLHHNEIQVRTRRVEAETWWKTTPKGPVGVLRAYFVPGARMAALFPMTALSEPPSDELAELFVPAIEWLRERDPAQCLAVASKPPGGVAESLERLGFSGVVSSTVMVRKTSG